MSISNNITDESEAPQASAGVPSVPARRNPRRAPTHPGVLLDQDVLPALALSKTEIAARLGLSRQHLYDILRAEKPVSPAVAARLGRFFGNGALFWLRMQAARDAWQAERDTDLSDVRPLTAAEQPKS